MSRSCSFKQFIVYWSPDPAATSLSKMHRLSLIGLQIHKAGGSKTKKLAGFELEAFGCLVVPCRLKMQNLIPLDPSMISQAPSIEFNWSPEGTITTLEIVDSVCLTKT